MLAPAGKCEQIQEVNWLELMQEPGLLKKPKLLPKIPGTTNLQLEPDTNNVSKSIPGADIPEIAGRDLNSC